MNFRNEASTIEETESIERKDRTTFVQEDKDNERKINSICPFIAAGGVLSNRRLSEDKTLWQQYALKNRTKTKKP